MTQDEIIEMAKQAGFQGLLPSEHTDGTGCVYDSGDEEITPLLEAFAKLVEAHIRGKIFKPDWDNYRQGLIDGAVSEREACAMVCDNAIASIWEYCPDEIKEASTNVCNNLAKAIRARSISRGEA